MHASLVMDNKKYLVDLGYITNTYNSLSLTTDVVKKQNLVHSSQRKVIEINFSKLTILFKNKSQKNKYNKGE